MRVLFFLLLCFLGKIASGQNIAIENSKAMNIIYPWRNSLTIVVEDIPCSQLYIKTDNGNIEGKNCNYEILPESVGRATIFIYHVNSTDTLLLGEKNFRVKRFPLSKPYIGNKSSGLISISELKAQLGVIVRIENFDIDAKVMVKKFRITFIRNNELFKQIENKDARFSIEVKGVIHTLRKGDKILIDKVYVRTPGVKEHLEVENSEFIIE